MPEVMRGRLGWFRTHPTITDALLAGALLAAALPVLFLRPPADDLGFRTPDQINAGFVAAIAASLTFRRRAPAVVVLFIAAAITIVAVLGYAPDLGAILAYCIAIYSVAAHRGLARSLLAGGVAIPAFIGVVLAATPDFDFIALFLDTAFIIGIWGLGRGIRLRRAYVVELEHRAERLERARGAVARVARVEERSRIARELHDVVAHHVSVMTVQAGAARRILDADPDGAREALSTIEGTGRSALGEMRRIIGVLRTDREPRGRERDLSPQPGVHDVSRLVDQLRETGLKVQLWVEGVHRPLSPGVDLAAYRLVQEALTNTLQHAGPQARARVRIHYDAQQLTVEVEDDGHGLTAGFGRNGDTPGHGLVGMRERVALYGGELRVGPRTDGGFEVRARFPLEA